MYIYNKHMLISHQKNAAQTLLKTVFPGSCDVETNYLYPGSSELELSSSILTVILFRITQKLRMERTPQVIWTNALLKARPHKYHLHKHFFPPPFFLTAWVHMRSHIHKLPQNSGDHHPSSQTESIRD